MGDNILSVEAILEVSDVTEKTVPIPEWNGAVVVKSITKREMTAIKNSAKNDSGDLDEDLFEKYITIAGLVKPQIDEAVYERLLDKSFSAMTKITQAILGTSNVTKEALKTEEKNFRPEQ